VALAACTRSVTGTVVPTAQPQRLFQLQGQIQNGPSAGLTLNGDLRLTLNTAGRLTGALARETGSAITVTGQIDGQAIHLAFDLGHAQVVLGVGTLQHGISNPQGTAGGILTGPQPGDNGNWFGSWTTIATSSTPPTAKPAQNSNSDLATSMPILISISMVAVLVVGLVLRQAISGKSLYTKTRGRSGIPFVKASVQTVAPERWPDEVSLPVAQFATTYAYGDDHYDLSFTIESTRGEFLGECGVGIGAVIGQNPIKVAAGSGIPAWLEPHTEKGVSPKHAAVTALEVWIFDKNDIQTITKVLRSAAGFYDPGQRSPANAINEVIPIESGQIVILETRTLRLRVKVLEVNYATALSPGQSVFEHVSLALAVWIK
jgi:hypothetical protein